MDNNQPKKAAIYCLVDKFSELLPNSLTNQSAYYFKLLEKRQDFHLTELYADDKRSKERPEFNRMLNDSKAGKFDYIISNSTSVFSRDSFKLLNYINELKEINIGVLFLNENIDTLNMDNVLYNICKMFEESKNINR